MATLLIFLKFAIKEVHRQMAILNSLMTWLMKKRMHQIELFMRYPHDVQYEWFRKLMNAARNTEYGRKFDFASITRPEQYRGQVPITTYEDIKIYIDRLRRGEQNLLWPEEIKWFAKSSGTTGDKSKFIPVSEDALEECHFKGAKDLLSVYCYNNPDTKLFTGKGLTLGGTHQIGEYDNDAYYGDVSAILIQNAPFWGQYIRTPNLSIALMDDWEEKIEQMTKVTSVENVTSLSGVPSWTLFLLKKILEYTGKSNIHDVWPNLELYMHGGVSFSPYRKLFSELIPSEKMNYFETYNASEGFFGLQFEKPGEMLLMLDYGVFYEFIHLDKFLTGNYETITLEDVKTDINYALVISTNAGLWRYIIGDTIKFTSLSPYKFVITGRTKSYINTFGEELMVDNSDAAIATACEKSGSIVTEYTAAPILFSGSESAAHEWIIEFSSPPENSDYFCEILDNALKALNSDYEAKRYKNLILKKPVIHTVPSGFFYNWLKSKGKLGGQNKIPRLVNDRKYMDELILLLK